MKILSLAYTFFLLMDAIGNIPFFISLLKNLDPKRQRQIIIRELLIALFIMITFSLIGDAILSSLNISDYSLLMSGGIILFILSLKMIFPSGSSEETKIDPKHDKEPFIVPLAIPLVAGPAVLAAIILYSKQTEGCFITISAIVLAWALSTIILLSSSLLKRWMGLKGIIACERLMGLLLVMLSIQMFLGGVTEYYLSLNKL
jgi:MarC family membrane protein